ncbi:MAG: 30S ribosomal protein S6 [Armatimonadota bacterium]
MTRPYEVVYIFDSALEEPEINERLERFHVLLKTPEVPEPVMAVSHWGRRSLAYPIAGRDVGYYVVTQFETTPEALPEFERLIKLDEQVLRHLLVVNEGLATAPAGPLAEEGPEEEIPGEDVEATEGADE